MANKLIKVKVRDTENLIFEGEVDRISSYNEVGPFDIYPMHANFISIIRQELALYQQHKKVKEVKIEQAVMKVKQDIVHIFLGIEAFLLDETLENKKAAPATPTMPNPMGGGEEPSTPGGTPTPPPAAPTM